ncbi:MAG: glycosyltransferase family 4 protein [Candidatus Margulisbacteria bacterium]|nr:glycosyltransferase family 4 protein [Candidatus Margulisiibacteriota bacterium]
MRIQLQHTYYYPQIGGIESRLYYTSKTLLEMGHEPTILCSRHLSTLPEKETYNGIKIIRYPMYRFPKLSVLSQLYFEKMLQGFIRRNSKGTEAVWTNHPYCAYASCKALPKIANIYFQPTIWTNFRAITGKELKGIRRMRFRIRNLFDYYLEKKSMEMCDKVITFSEERMREIVDFNKLIKGKIEVVRTGVDLERFKVRGRDKDLLKELNIPENANIILTVCRLALEKNVGMLINAFTKINCSNCHLVVVGDGPERAHLEQLVKRLNMEKKVRFTGFRRDTERFYSISDVFVLPSENECFGLVYLEAMASGVPCIGLKSDYPNVIVGTEELIKDGYNGYCVNPYSTDDLTEKIEKIVLNEELRCRMGQEARQICEREYRWKRHVEALIKITECIRKRK